MHDDQKSQDQFEGIELPADQRALMQEYAQIEAFTKASTAEELRSQCSEVERAHEIINLLKSQGIVLRWEPTFGETIQIQICWEVPTAQGMISVPMSLPPVDRRKPGLGGLRLRFALEEGWSERLQSRFYQCIGLLPSPREMALMLVVSILLGAFVEATTEASLPMEIEDLKRQVMDLAYLASWDEQVALVYPRNARTAFLSDFALCLSRFLPFYRRDPMRVTRVAQTFCGRGESPVRRSIYLSLLKSIAHKRSFNKVSRAFPLVIGSDGESDEEIELENGLYELVCVLLGNAKEAIRP
jgi:hypothetical protein